MIWDGQALFEPLAGRAITTTGVSTNSIDIGPYARDIGILDYPSPLIVVDCLTSFASGTPTATLTIALQAAPDNGGVAGNFVTIDTTPPIPLGQLGAGNRPYKQSITILSELLPASAIVTGTFSCGSGAGTITVASATGLLDGQYIAASGVLVPGTQITTISGTTISISPNTAAAASAGTPFAATSAMGTAPAMTKLPRFAQLLFTCSATFTAGSVCAGIVIDVDKPSLYAPGFVWPAAA